MNETQINLKISGFPITIKLIPNENEFNSLSTMIWKIILYGMKKIPFVPKSENCLKSFSPLVCFIWSCRWTQVVE